MLQVTGELVLYVCYSFGSFAYISVRVYKGKTLDECVKMASEDIYSYYFNHKWNTIG